MMAMNSSDEPTAIQRIVRAAAELRTFSRTELSEKARTKPSTTRVVLKRLRDKWPEAISVEASEAKQGGAGGFHRYTISDDFRSIESLYGNLEDSPTRSSDTASVLAEFMALAEAYLTRAKEADQSSLEQEKYLLRTDQLLSQQNQEEVSNFPKLQLKFSSLQSELSQIRSVTLNGKATEKKEKKKKVVEAPKLVRMKSTRNGSPQKRVEDRIIEFCKAFASFDLSVLAFDKIIYPVFSEMMDRTAIRNLAGSVTDYTVAGEVWNRQLQINTRIKSNIRDNIMAHLMSDDASGKAAYETIVVRDGNEKETLQTALEINSAWMNRAGKHSGAELAWKVNEHRLLLPRALTSPVLFTYFRNAINHNYFRVSNDWMSLLDRDLNRRPIFWDYKVRGLDSDASASLALLAIAELDPFNRDTLQQCVRHSIVHSIGTSFARHGNDDSDAFRPLYGHSASILVDQSADPRGIADLSSCLHGAGIMPFTSTLSALSPEKSDFVGSAQEFSPAIMIVAVDGSRLSPETLSTIENLRGSSCVLVDLSGISTSSLPNKFNRVVRANSRGEFNVQQVVEAATDAVVSSAPEDFELYGSTKPN